jgi:cytochrome P450
LAVGNDLVEFPGGHRYAWMPCGAGPRACIGMQIAMLEIPIVIAAVLQAFELKTPLTSIPVHAAITLQPAGSLPLRSDLADGCHENSQNHPAAEGCAENLRSARDG